MLASNIMETAERSACEAFEGVSLTMDIKDGC